MNHFEVFVEAAALNVVYRTLLDNPGMPKYPLIEKIGKHGYAMPKLLQKLYDQRKIEPILLGNIDHWMPVVHGLTDSEKHAIAAAYNPDANSLIEYLATAHHSGRTLKGAALKLKWNGPKTRSVAERLASAGVIQVTSRSKKYTDLGIDKEALERLKSAREKYELWKTAPLVESKPMKEIEKQIESHDMPLAPAKISD